MQYFAESQQIEQDIANLLTEYVCDNLTHIKWAIKGSEAGLSVKDITDHTNQDAPLGKTCACHISPRRK